MTHIVFWSCAAYVAYVYVGYPLLLRVVGLLRSPRVVTKGATEESVVVIVSAYNESSCILDKLKNFQELDFPPEKIEMLVVSDACSDGTDEIVTSFGDPRVKLLRMPSRGGKTAGLNAALQSVSAGIVVFTDANAMFAPSAIRQMAGNFADSSVGGVVGESGYRDSSAAADVEERRYWSYESAIKAAESDLGSVVGGDGAIYAIRRELYEPMPHDGLSDFLNPLQIVRREFRFVYDPSAKCFEDGAETFAGEYRRKVRIVNRAWRTAMRMRELLNPLKYGLFAVQFASHKIMRWLVPFILAGLFLSSAAIAGSSPVGALAFALQSIFYALAFAGALLRSRKTMPTFLGIPYYFTMVNIASARGVIEAQLGKTYTTWTTVRETKPT